MLTFAAVRDTLIALDVATAEEIDGIAAELAAFAERADTVVSCPRISQAWGRKR
ncbi:MAG TPA: hypothetical protein VF339_13795 [Gammaproteobacteria bacterium]